MGDALRSEFLKARSGFWMLAVAVYALLLPAVGSMMVPPKDVADAAEATHRVIGYAALCPMAAVYLGTWIVTREYYYRSIARTVLAARKFDAFRSKVIVGGACGIVSGAVGVAGWCVFAANILRGRHHEFVVDSATLTIIAGTVVASALGGIIGVAIGWAVPNYYGSIAIAFLLPLGVELPLVLTVPSIGRFLPNASLAGIAHAPLGGLLSTPLALVTAVVWTALIAVIGWKLFEKREIR